MPFVRLTIADPMLSEDKQQELATGFTELLDQDLHKDAEVAVVYIHLVSPKQWYVHAKQHPKTIGAHAEISITNSSNSGAQKAQFLAHAYALFERVLGALPPAVYVALYEMNPESYGYNGISQFERHNS